MTKCFSVWGALALLVLTTACTKSSPSRPSDVTPAEETASSVTDAKSGVTLTTPAPVSPAANAQIRFADQPVTLTIRNAVTTGSSALTYTFQVADDAAFANIVANKEGVAQGAGQTSAVLDKLAGAKTYYWRARVNSGSVNGLFSTPRAMNIGPEVVLQPPTIVSPSNGGTLTGQASLLVTNVSRTGPAGPLTYRFEISDSSSFSNLVFLAASVPEQGGQTSVRMDANLTTNATYFLRVRASDASNGVTGPYSSVISFKYVPFDMAMATIVNSPPDLASWPETSKITNLAFTGDAFIVDFDKRTGPGRWPDVVPAGWDGPLQYTLGTCVNPGGNHWYCSGVVQFWYGRTLGDSGAPSRLGIEWFYDPVRWGPMHYYTPAEGELVGIFAAAGNLRDGGSYTRATCPRVCERTNVVLVPWTYGGKDYEFSTVKTR